MGSYAQENKRALVMLAVAGAVLIIVLGMRLLGGQSDEVQTGPVPRPTPTVEQAEETLPEQQVATNVESVTAGRTDPFAPLAGTEEDAGTSGREAAESSGTSSSAGGASGKGSFTTDGSGGTTRGDDAGSSTPQRPVEKPRSDTPAPQKTTAPIPVRPQPVDEPTGDPADSRTRVRLVSVAPDSAVVTINGERTTLYLAVPDPSTVTYVSPLGGGCAWLTAGDASERVSVCTGETVRL